MIPKHDDWWVGGLAYVHDTIRYCKVCLRTLDMSQYTGCKNPPKAHCFFPEEKVWLLVPAHYSCLLLEAQ